MTNPISYTEFYGYLAFRAIANDFFDIFIAPQLGGFHAKGAATYTWGTPWLYGKFVFSNAVQARVGVKLGTVGQAFRRKDTEYDFGLLYRQVLNSLSFDAGLSYRIRQKGDLSGLPNFGGLYTTRPATKSTISSKHRKNSANRSFFLLWRWAIIAATKSWTEPFSPIRILEKPPSALPFSCKQKQAVSIF